MSPGDVRVSAEPVGELARPWGELALRSGNIFSTYEWARLWWEHVLRSEQPAVTVTIRQGEHLLGILPFVGSRLGPLRLVRFLGHGLADELGPICDATDLPRVAPLLSAGVRAFQPDADLFVGDAMSGRIDWAEHLSGRVVAREASPVLRIRGRSWDEFLADHSRNFRKDVRSAERRVMRIAGTAIRQVVAPSELPSALDWLFRLHRSRWGSGSQFARTESFHRGFAAAALSHGWLRLWVLQTEGAPVAVWYGFRFGPAVSGYQSGRDPNWDRYGVGRVLREHAIRAATEEGAEEFRLLRGNEGHKWRYANHDDGVVSFGMPFSMLGSAGLAGYGMASRVMHARDVARLRIGRIARRADA
jgi:CelD/BcsL family acetyltransferase involved in cellulose biosynthesis